MEIFKYDKKYVLISNIKLILFFLLISFAFYVIDITGTIIVFFILIIKHIINLSEDLMIIKISDSEIQISYKLKGKTEIIKIDEIKSIKKVSASLKIPWGEDGVEIETSRNRYKIFYTYFKDYKRLRNTINKVWPISD